MWHVELVIDGRSELAECPVWDPASDALYWVEPIAQRIHRHAITDGHPAARVLEAPTRVGSIALRESGGLIAALEGSIWVHDGRDGLRESVTLDSSVRARRFNDGKCDPAGRLWAGTVATSLEDADGALYRLTPNGRLVPIVTGIGMSNGLGWSPSGDTMYFVDTRAGRVDAMSFDIERGQVSDRRLFARISRDHGLPDGLAVDALGNVWVALWGAGELRRYRPDGSADFRLRVPTARVSSCAFGGSGLEWLYITTARQGASAGELDSEPHAGGVFRWRADVPGLPVRGFADEHRHKAT